MNMLDVAIFVTLAVGFLVAGNMWRRVAGRVVQPWIQRHAERASAAIRPDAE